MSQDITGIVNLDYIVKRVLMDLKDYSLVNYKTFLQYAIDGFMDLNLAVMQNVKIAYLPVASNKTADLPIDYMAYTKVGFNDGGSVTVLGVNNNLMLTRLTNDCGNLTNENSDSCSAPIEDGVYQFAPHWYNGQYCGELYAGSGDGVNDGKFRIDREKHKICFDSDVSASTIILEYKSSGVSGDGSTNVPRQFAPALIRYVHWQRREYNDKVPQGVKDALRQRYYDAFEEVKTLEMSFTLDEYFAVKRASYSALPKR